MCTYLISIKGFILALTIALFVAHPFEDRARLLTGSLHSRHQLSTVLRATPNAIPPVNSNNDFSVLVFSKTVGFRHASIEAGKTLLQALGAANNFQPIFSEDSAIFTDGTLAGFDCVIFLNTTGDILNDEQQAAFERFMQAGHGFVGIHSASDTEYEWPWYESLVGAYFASHPVVQDATLLVIDPVHPSTVDLPNPWLRNDEWYNFQNQPVGVNVLLQVDEGSYAGGTMGAIHPISWAHTYGGGRSWYTAMGHTAESFAEPLFQQHLLGGILWAIGDQDVPMLTPTSTPSVTPTVTIIPSVTATPTMTATPTVKPDPLMTPATPFFLPLIAQ